jgi:hypothetical protein
MDVKFFPKTYIFMDIKCISNTLKNFYICKFKD